ncbi:MAG: PKD domain-containing protein [Thermoplasmatota archaeon]
MLLNKSTANVLRGEKTRSIPVLAFAALASAAVLFGALEMIDAGEASRSSGPILPNPDWSGIPTIPEDSIPMAVLLDCKDPPFVAENESIIGYLLAPPGSLNGSVSILTTIAEITVIGEVSSHSLLIEPLPGMSGWASFELIGLGENHTCNRTAALRISPVNDPPVVHSLTVKGRDHPVTRTDEGGFEIDLSSLETVHDGTLFNFTINATDGDAPDEGDALFFKFDAEGSDIWDERPVLGVETGEVSLTITLDDWRSGNERLLFRIRDRDLSEVVLLVILEIDHINIPPLITVPVLTRERWTQYEMLEVDLEVEDLDSNGAVLIEANIESSLGGSLPPLKEQLPHLDLVPGGNVGLDPSTGIFWLDLADQDIWKTGGIYIDSVQIFVMFKATDILGASSNVTLNFELVDTNEPPVWTGQLNVTPMKPAVGQRVTFWVDPARDPDMDHLIYHWDLGDGSKAEGRVVEHIYYIKGWRTVQCWASDGNESTEKLAIRIEVQEKNYDEWGEWYDMDNDGDGVLNRDDSFPNDRAASKDSDSDGYPDEWNRGYDKLDSTTGLRIDAFPYDRGEWTDSDGDGRGDNGDEFPHDSSEWRDTDGDGIGDNEDRFPHVPNGDIKWYAAGIASFLLVVIALLLFILRNTVNRRDRYLHYDEE